MVTMTKDTPLQCLLIFVINIQYSGVCINQCLRMVVFIMTSTFYQRSILQTQNYFNKCIYMLYSSGNLNLSQFDSVHFIVCTHVILL